MPGRRQTGPGRDASTGTSPRPAGEIPDPVSPSEVQLPPGHCVNSAPRRHATERIIRRERQTLRCRNEPRTPPVVARASRPCVDRRFALSAQPRFLSLSSSKKEERAGERRRYLSISPLSDSLPARSSQGERGKTPEAFCVPNTTG